MTPIHRLKSHAPRVRARLENGRFMLAPAKNFYRIEEAADVFSVSPRTIMRWLDDGRLAAVRPGIHRLVSADSIVRLLMKDYLAAFALPGDSRRTAVG